MGIDAQIVTRRWSGDRILQDAIPVRVTSDTETKIRRGAYGWLERAAWQVESRVAAYQASRYSAAMGSETSYRPFLSPCLADAIGISRYVREMRPQFVCGQEVFAYGLATAFSWNVPRLLMPWGGDVYMYSETTSVAFAGVRHALRHVDLVVPGSPLARDHLHRRFGVSNDHMHCGGLWALDRKRFQPASETARLGVCARFGIDPSALVVMNVRRFFPAWGSDLAFGAFVRFAKEHASAHFVLLGGSGTEAFVAAARDVLGREGLSGRFTLFDGDIALEDCAALMSITDIFVSLMREQDMRPLASILEAAACGGAPIIGDQPEYRAMERQGFSGTLCAPGDVEPVVEALRRYAASPAVRAQTARRNLAYLDEHENGRQQAVDLLRLVRSICDRYEQKQRPQSPVL
jgi:glycosyltransferase involved in cell wall biosynthesis